MLKGYPIGTFILWKTRERLRCVRDIGGAELPTTPDGDYAKQVLDGQQRLTSLYASIHGIEVEREGHVEDFSEIYIDLEADANGDIDADIVFTEIRDRPEKTYVRLTDLMNRGFVFFGEYPEKYHNKIDTYKSRLKSYSFSVILVSDAPIEVATEIFTRINTGGTVLKTFEIMVAKTFDVDRDFDLAEKYDELVASLDDAGYSTVPSAVVLQAIAAILGKQVGKKEILRLPKKDFIDAWPAMVDALCEAVDYLKSAMRIPVSDLLPYYSLLVPLAYFFHHHGPSPNADRRKLLEDFFWRVALTSRYSRSAESQLEQDLRRMDDIIEGKQPEYDAGVDTSAQFIVDNGVFKSGRAYIKALLCILAYKQPKSFENNALVTISNDWLKRANSKNYHHFFPKAHLKRQGYEGWEINHIANITIVDDYLNKRRIRDKAPATYMRQFEKSNDRLPQTMRSHLINLQKDGIWKNDYETFFMNRCRAFSRELRKRIIPQKIDERGQEAALDDDETAETYAA
jgi:hypothetical protein